MFFGCVHALAQRSFDHCHQGNDFGSLISAEVPVLEPFQYNFRWCLKAINGYAKVDPNQ
jgi:hypothetical protein